MGYMRDLLYFTPPDKSKANRRLFLDAMNRKDDTIKVVGRMIAKREQLGKDIVAGYLSAGNWNSGEPMNVLESGSVYRYYRFAAWKLGQDRKFVKTGTLVDRKICDDPNIVNYSLKELGKVDKRTSQWQSAAAMMGNIEYLENPPYKFQVTKQVIKDWTLHQNAQEKFGRKIRWDLEKDDTILELEKSFLNMIRTGNFVMEPRDSERFCYLNILGDMTPEEGKKRWSSLEGHEENRIIESEKAKRQVIAGERPTSMDHRIQQACGLLQIYRGQKLDVNMRVIDKTWELYDGYAKLAKDFKERLTAREKQ